MARKKKTSRKKKKVVKMEALKQINFNAAGLDIGSAEIWTAVPEERDEQPVQKFDTFTADLHALADWLISCDVDTVAMESTGVYWIPIFEILEERGLEVLLVNARHIKNVTGRKTDVLDCQWIQQLHTYGLLRGSFRPSAEIASLRSYIRHRNNMLRYRAAHTQHMQKALHLMNIQLTNVLSDITGMTGMLIIRDIIAGVHNPVLLAQHRDPRCHSTEDEIAKALTGNYRQEHLFVLQQAVELYDFYTGQIEQCDIQIEEMYSKFIPKVDSIVAPLPPVKKKKRKNNPDFDLRSKLYQTCGIDLTRVDGLDSILVQDIISEIGVDMNKWETSKHFSSWLRLCPYNDISGGKVLKNRTGKTTNRANLAFRLAARSTGRSDSATGAFYRRIKARHGAAKAITATAHKIARIVYHMLKYQEEYRDTGAEAYEIQYQARILKNLQRKARKLGMALTPLAT